MLNTAIEESKNISKETRYSSIEQLKIFLKSQVVKKADLGEISVSENISKEINQHQIKVYTQRSGYARPGGDTAATAAWRDRRAGGSEPVA